MRMVQPIIRAVDIRTVKLPPKRIGAQVYNSPQFIAWRAMVLKRAGYRCEAVDQYGHRCGNAKPEHRLFADHIIELRDGGSLTDPSNGQCLCKSHHERKTIRARVDRLKR